MDDQLEHPRPQVLAQRDLRTADANDRNRPQHVRVVQEANQLVARRRERRLHGGRAGPGKPLGGRPQGGGEGILGNFGIGIFDPVQPEELPHRHRAETDRLRVGQQLLEPDDAVHRMRSHTAHRVPRHDAGLAPDGGEFRPTEDPAQPVDAGHVGVNLIEREPASHHTLRVGDAMDHEPGVPSAARSCGFPDRTNLAFA